MTTTLTLVLWLQSGRELQTVAVPDSGRPPIQHCLRVLRPRPPMVLPTSGHVVSASCEIDTLTFHLTAPSAIAAAEYALGRRRFHYLEATGWRSREELYQRDLGEQARRFARIHDGVQKHLALLETGAFPAHTCALPPGWSLIAEAIGIPHGTWTMSIVLQKPYGIT
jgi:hypothetical protein